MHYGALSDIQQRGTCVTSQSSATVPLFWQLRRTCWLARLLYIEISCPNFYLIFTDAFITSSCEPNGMWLWESALKSPFSVISWDLGSSSPSAVISWEKLNAMRDSCPQQQHNKKQNMTTWHRRWGLAVGAVGYESVKFFHPVEPRDLGWFGLVSLHQIQGKWATKTIQRLSTWLVFRPKARLIIPVDVTLFKLHNKTPLGLDLIWDCVHSSMDDMARAGKPLDLYLTCTKAWNCYLVWKWLWT